MGGSPRRRSSLMRFVNHMHFTPLRLERSSKYVDISPIKDGTSLPLTAEPTATAPSTPTSVLSATKKVGFGSVEVRSYPVVIGDHPMCEMGCPLSLGWEYSERKPVPVDEYEGTRAPRRDRESLRTTCEERRQFLSDFSDNEVKRAERKLYRDRSCRKTTIARDGFFSDQELCT